jgi:hypothetical protein
LLGLFGENKPIPTLAAGRVQRWALFLSAYDYRLSHRKGALNGNADCLSRLPQEAELEDITQGGSSVFMMDLVAAPVTAEEVRTATRRDPVLSKVLEVVQTGGHFEEGESAFKPFRVRLHELSHEDGVLLWGSRVVILGSMQGRVLEELHQMHTGMVKMKALARGYAWWPCMDEAIEVCCRGCHTCQENLQKPNKAPIHVWEYPSKPWERLHLDFAGPFLGKMFLIVVDAHSKWMEVCIMNSVVASSTIEQLRMIFATHGLPSILVSDNGPTFISEEFRTFTKFNGIKHIFAVPYHWHQMDKQRVM